MNLIHVAAFYVKIIFKPACAKINMRLFVAIEISNQVRKRIQEHMKQFSDVAREVRLVSPKNLHFTVKFLGEVDEDKLHDIETYVTEVVKEFKPFEISVGRVGFFGDPSHIKTVWIDVVEGRETIIRLMRNIDSRLKHIRWDGREPVPHLTIGRVKKPVNTLQLYENISETIRMNFGSMCVESVKLKSSTLTPEGPVYSDVKTFPLGG